jgi:hypothetical protein
VQEELHTDWEEFHTEHPVGPDMAALLADPDREEHPVGLEMAALLADSDTQVVRVDKEELLEGSPGEVAYNLDHLDSG